MATKTARPSRRRTPAKNEQPSGVVEIVVRRGAARRFDALKNQTTELPVVVSWDRRAADRRTATSEVSRDQRSTDRRKRPAFTWDLADFVVVAPTPPGAKPRKKASKKS